MRKERVYADNKIFEKLRPVGEIDFSKSEITILIVFRRSQQNETFPRTFGETYTPKSIFTHEMLELIPQLVFQSASDHHREKD